MSALAQAAPRGRARRKLPALPSSLVAGVVTFVVLLATYLRTAAPDLSFWDASELTTAAHTFGIPHPPGTPLWVALGRVAALVFSAAGPARAVTLLSVWATAAAGALGAAMATRWIGARGAVAAAVGAGTMMSVWANATETEVYAVSLLLSVAMLLAGERAGRTTLDKTDRARWRALLAFLAALSVPVHLSALVALPAAMALAWHGPRPTRREVATWVALMALALSAVAILPLRAQHAPLLNSGRPVSLDALLAVLRRDQYAVAGLWPRSAPLWLQLGNVFEWADWQVAFGLHPVAPPAFSRTALSVVWGWLSLLGARTLWQHDRRVARGMALLVLSGTVGVALWLNLKAGPSFGDGVLALGAAHEARERDYFFALGFWAWGLLAGIGLSGIATRLLRSVPAAIAPAMLLVAVVPMLANSPVMDRGREPASVLPRAYARLLLDAVPNGGVLLSAGDNDTFPLWYLQQVEDYRTDVTVVTVPLLGAAWFREELAARYRLLDSSEITRSGAFGAAVVRRAVRNGRAVRVSALLSGADRRALDANAGWVLEGLVYAPSADVPIGSVGLDLSRLRQARDRVPPGLLAPLAPGTDPAGEQLQSLLRCATVVRLDDPLLVSSCGGA